MADSDLARRAREALEGMSAHDARQLEACFRNLAVALEDGEKWSNPSKFSDSPAYQRARASSSARAAECRAVIGREVARIEAEREVPRAR